MKKGIGTEKIEREAKEFESRRKRFADSFGSNAGFVLAAVCGAMETILSLGKEGRAVVRVRTGEYRRFDPEIIGVDEIAEAYFLQRIDEHFGDSAAVLSEEAGRLPAKGNVGVIFVSDPFDGSKLYKRGIESFWFTTLAIYSPTGKALAAAVCNVTHGIVDFANEDKAYSGKFVAGEIKDVKPITPAKTEKLADSALETYLMNPRTRLYPASEIFKPLISQVLFLLPNGGPPGYTDVASGRVDIYLALEEAHIENFAALPIAWRAGASVTHFDGSEVNFEDKIDKRYFIVCSANDALHEQVLSELAKTNWEEHPHYRNILEENKRISAT